MNAIQIFPQRPVPTSFADLPIEILALIFDSLPVKDRFAAGRVCATWRRAFLETSSCWRDITVGRNSNFHSITPPPFHLVNPFPLSHVREIKLIPAYPTLVEYPLNWDSEPVTNQLKEIPFPWLSLILKRCRMLNRLDLSSLLVQDEHLAAFR